MYVGTLSCTCSSPSVGHWRRVLHTAFHVSISFFFVVHVVIVLCRHAITRFV